MPIQSPLKVAIVGAGPGGLAAAIQISRLPDIELSLFEAAKELREIGAVCGLQRIRARKFRTDKPFNRESISTKILGDCWMISELLTI